MFEFHAIGATAFYDGSRFARDYLAAGRGPVPYDPMRVGALALTNGAPAFWNFLYLEDRIGSLQCWHVFWTRVELKVDRQC
jgi:hypothetical protein